MSFWTRAEIVHVEEGPLPSQVPDRWTGSTIASHIDEVPAYAYAPLSFA